MIPALEGTSLKSNCESVSRSWKSPIKASTSKETPKTKKNNPKKKTKVKASDEPIESRITCPESKELSEDPPNEDWIMCASCEKWWHENCTSYLGRGEFFCDEC
nr:unnamed protein product [Callosobruchus chinensis]